MAVRLPTLPKPSTTDMKKAVFRGVQIKGGLDNSVATYIHFSPTLGIAAARLNKFGMDIRSFHQPLERAVRQVVIPSIRANFDSEGRPPWEDLTETTIGRRQYLGYAPGPILNRSGQLERAAVALARWRITKNTAVFTNLPEKVWYGVVHQAGAEGTAGRGGFSKFIEHGKSKDTKKFGGQTPEIPPRPFVQLQPEEEDQIQEIFLEWLEERRDRAWPGV